MVTLTLQHLMSDKLLGNACLLKKKLAQDCVSYKAVIIPKVYSSSVYFPCSAQPFHHPWRSLMSLQLTLVCACIYLWFFFISKFYCHTHTATANARCLRHWLRHWRTNNSPIISLTSFTTAFAKCWNVQPEPCPLRNVRWAPSKYLSPIMCFRTTLRSAHNASL